MKSLLLAVLLVVVLIGLIVPPVCAQTAATLSGTIADPTGAVMPDAKVSVINVNTNVLRQTTTNKDGYFIVPELVPGTYTVQVQRDGFAPAKIDKIVLNTADRRNLEIKLTVGRAAETVDVTATTAAIDTSTGVSTVVNRGFVENTALNGRSFQSLLQLTPGVVLNPADGNLSFNGMRSDTNYFTVDGVSANVGMNSPSFTTSTGVDEHSLNGTVPGLNILGSTQAMLGLDAMEEFRVQSSAISAQYGRQMGAQVQLTSRSGTNTFHGSVFDYLRNDALDAMATYPQNPTAKKPKLRQNNYGGTFGGPIRKDKTFFFFGYEGQRNAQPPTNSNLYLVPSVALRNGDPGLLNEWLSLPGGYPTPATSSSTMPASVQALFKTLPLPNVPCPASTGYTQYASDPTQCVATVSTYTGKTDGLRHSGLTARNGRSYWQGSLSNYQRMGNWSLKLDHTLSSRVSGFLRYSDAGSTSLNNVSGLTSGNSSKAATAGVNWLPTNTISNSLRVNFTSATGSASYGIGNIHDGGVAPGANAILDPLISNFAYAYIGTPAGTLFVGGERSPMNRQWNVVDDVTWSHGKHTIVAGFDWRYLFPKLTSRNVANPLRIASNVPDAYSNTVSSMSLVFDSPVTVVTNNYSAYFQDTWRATSRLTLDLGLRWEINPAFHGRHAGDFRYVTGWSDPATMSLAPAGTDYYDTPWKAFAPRLGAAYRVSNRAGWETVVRGGWGIFYDLAGSLGTNGFAYYPNARKVSPVSTYTSLDSFAALLATPAPVPSSVSGQTLLTRLDNFSLPKSYQWNLSLQQSLGKDQTVTASYIGNLGRDMLRYQIVFEDSGTTRSSFANANLKGATFVFQRNDSGWGDTSDYHALQVQYQRRMTRGLEALANWTWGHAIDTNSNSNLAANLFNGPAPIKYRANSDFDRRHIFNVALTYEPPRIGKLGESPLSSALKMVADGWLFSTIFKAQTGTPLTVTVQKDMTPYENGYNIVRADLVSGQPIWTNDPKVAGGKYLNPNAFVFPASCLTLNPADCQNGNEPRNGILGFGLWQADASVRRLFPVHERVKLEFRADFFNLLNHPNWANPGTSLGYILNLGKGLENYQILNTPSPTGWGYSPNMLANGIGGGLNSLYQTGGPRSIQLALKLSF